MMFGASRKKSKATRVPIAEEDESSDDEDDSRRRLKQNERRKKNKKRRGDKKKKEKAVMLSFDPEDDDGDEEAPSHLEHKSKQKKKKHSKKKSKRGAGGGSLGYGGGMMAMNTSDESASDAGKDVEDKDKGNCYDADALQKLKAEQKHTELVKEDTTTNESKEVLRESNTNQTDETTEEEFISLSGSSKSKKNGATDSFVLTGDEAMKFAEQDEDANHGGFDHGLQFDLTQPTNGIVTEKGVSDKVADLDTSEPSEEVEEGNNRWEDTMARRAGVLPPKSALNEPAQVLPRQRTTNQQSPPSLDQLKSSLQPTITNLQNKVSDLETSARRHQLDLSSAREELTQKQQTLEKNGKALEYYQGLREDLATWMGALRELDGMVHKVEQAKRKLEAEISWTRMERFWEWGIDCTDILDSQNLLKNKVTGKGVEMNTNENEQTMQVDEFGRNLSSMATMARTKRCDQRRKRTLHRLKDTQHDNPLQKMFEISNEDNIGNDEIQEWKHRQQALAQAITIIPNFVKDDYQSISNLCSLFIEWERMYPDEYANCYAEMSLVQMISVLVRLELCERWGLLGLDFDDKQSHSHQISDFKWFKHGDNQKCIFAEVIQKCIVNRFLELLSINGETYKLSTKHGTYNPFSANQTAPLCSLLKSTLEFLASCTEDKCKAIYKETRDKVLDTLLSSVTCCIGKMSVPVLDETKVTVMDNEFIMRENSAGFDNELADALAYATLVQARELCALVKNIVHYWYPLFDKEKASSLIQFLFNDLVSLRIVPILHSLHGMASGTKFDCKIGAKIYISELLGVLQESGLLEEDKWMILTAPLRAAADMWNVVVSS